jgi:hypothetical protein
VTPIAVAINTPGTPIPLPVDSGAAGIAINKSSPTQDPDGILCSVDAPTSGECAPVWDAPDYYWLHTPRTPASRKPSRSTEHQQSGGNRGTLWPSRSCNRARRAGVPPMSPSWPRTFRSAWHTLTRWLWACAQSGSGGGGPPELLPVAEGSAAVARAERGTPEDSWRAHRQ